MATETKTTVSIALPPALLKRLDDAATILDRSRSWVVAKAAEEYLARHETALIPRSGGAT